MKTKLHLTIAAFALAVIGHSVSAQTTFTYDFNTNLNGVVTPAGSGNPAVGSMPLAAPTSTRPIFDGTVQNTTGVFRQQTIDGLIQNTNVNNLTSFPAARDYSVTWKEYLFATPPATIGTSTINSHRRGFLLRGQSVAATPYAPGIRNGYYFYLQGDHTSPGRIQFIIRQVVNGALQANLVTFNAYLDGGTIPISLDKAYWYRASVTGTNTVALKFEYSLDGINFVTAINHNDTTGTRFTTAGLTQTVSGIGFASYIWHYYDNVTFTSNDPITTWNGTAWNNGAPTASQRAIINSNYSAAGNLVAGDLEVTGNAVATIPSGNTFTVPGVLRVDPTASLTVENNANLIQSGTTNTNTSNINVKRSSSALSRLDFTLWSSPVTGSQTLAEFSPKTSQNPSRFYTYNEGQNRYDAVTTPTTTTFDRARGYLIRMPNDAAAAPATETFTGTFTGVPNNGNISRAVTCTLPGECYNLIGNPYPSTISADAFINANTANIENSLYFWRKVNAALSSAYAVYNPMGGTIASPSSAIPNGIIQVGQGFIVKAKSGASSVNFTNAMRVTNNANQFFRTNNAQKDRLWLNLTNTAGVFSQTLIGFTADASLGIDIFDAKYINDSPVALTSQINNEEFSIQGRPAFAATDVVALNFKTDVAGEYTIALNNFDGVFATNQNIFLVDSKTGAETNLKNGAYTFSATAGTDNTRFKLTFESTLSIDNPSFNDSSVFVYKNNGSLHVNAGTTEIKSVSVYDIQGRVISQLNNVNATNATITNLRPNQVLIVKIIGADNAQVSKKVVY